jgi:hypothetical protein
MSPLPEAPEQCTGGPGTLQKLQTVGFPDKVDNVGAGKNPVSEWNMPKRHVQASFALVP